MIFGTSSLEVLSLGSGWLSDGTFKAVPSIFTQLYTLHSFLDGAWTPRIYALLSDKHIATYVKLLCHVIDLIAEAEAQPHLRVVPGGNNMVMLANEAQAFFFFFLNRIPLPRTPRKVGKGKPKRRPSFISSLLRSFPIYLS